MANEVYFTDGAVFEGLPDNVLVTLVGGKLTETSLSIPTVESSINNISAAMQYITIVDSKVNDLSATVSSGSQQVSGNTGFIYDFTNADIVSDVITVDHNLNEQYVLVDVYDENDNKIIPDSIIVVDGASLDINLASYTPIVGTWKVVVHSKTFYIDESFFNNIQNNILITEITSSQTYTESVGTFAFSLDGNDITFIIPDADLTNVNNQMRFFINTNTSSNKVIIKTLSDQIIGSISEQVIIKESKGFTIVSYDNKWNIIQDSRSFNRYLFQSPEMDSPNNSDWVVNSLAPATADSINPGIVVRSFDDTNEEGVGFNFPLPTGASYMSLTIYSKAGSVQSGNVIPKIYLRTMSNEAQLTSWSGGISLNPVSVTSDFSWHIDNQILDFSSLSIPPSSQQIFIELTRDASNVSDTLIGDWILFQVKIEVA